MHCGYGIEELCDLLSKLFSELQGGRMFIPIYLREKVRLHQPLCFREFGRKEILERIWVI